ncbi:MAG: CDP-alcohol phosphatidyltransferase family protein [Oscillospiraceae bacterium]|jgi:cardiolipin synthase|nr:CDP-alcohol phosphatidyltransferase family protein [Oscillospiraceae bacterium]
MAGSEGDWKKLANLPNMLTVSRIILIGVFLWVFFAGMYYPAVMVFALAGATDLLDGYFARKNGQITWLGKLLDPVADKLMVCAALVALAVRGWSPWWLLIVVAMKETLMMLGGLVLLKKSIVVQAQPIGKAATALFLLAIAATFFHDLTAPVDYVLQYIACAATVAALLWYAKTAYRLWRGNIGTPPKG